MWWVTSSPKDGVSALGLKRILGCSYKTAWMLLHKLRRTMVNPGNNRLSGKVEVAKTFLSGFEGQHSQDKALIAIAAKFKGSRIRRIRLKHICDASSESLLTFIKKSIEQGSMIHTDGWTGYAGLNAIGYNHKVTGLKRKRESLSDLLPHVHQIVSLLKDWLKGMNHSAISIENLDYYLDEFVFRYNNRTPRSRGKLFYWLVQQSMLIMPVAFKDIRQNVHAKRATHIEPVKNSV